MTSPTRLESITSNIFDYPLKKLSSKNSSRLEKAVAVVALAILMVFSLGYYGVHVKRFYTERNFEEACVNLERAIVSGDQVQINDLFKQYPNLKNELNGTHGRTPKLFHLAIEKNKLEVAKLLLEKGAEINIESRMGSPLAVAVIKGNLPATEWLLKQKANPDIGDGYRPPILLANEIKTALKFEIIELLLNNGASPNIRLNQSLLSFIAAPWNRDIFPNETKKCINLLLEKGAELIPQDDVFKETLQYINDQKANIISK
ncbi:MAG: ankyrin repeat domain-containing protein [Parachlamydiaceae bacterium]|nr:ankyrin repeat domain-containing protein [Parachlamydiaceae bacterium]